MPDLQQEYNVLAQCAHFKRNDKKIKRCTDFPAGITAYLFHQLLHFLPLRSLLRLNTEQMLRILISRPLLLQLLRANLGTQQTCQWPFLTSDAIQYDQNTSSR